MIKTEEQLKKNIEDNSVRQKAITNKVDDVLQHKIPIELEDILKNSNNIVLMEGAPGCGKSTLSLYMCHRWTDGDLFQEFKLVILVRLRDLAIQTATKIADLLPQQNKAMGEDIAEEITSNNGRGVLFILDGWDELPCNVSGHSIILSLIEQTKLQECSIIITSRPTSTANLYLLVSSRVEILGFTKDELRDYFSDCLQQNTEDVESLLLRIKGSPVLEGSCYLPLNASILVHLFKCGGNVLPTTQYSIFSALICNCILRHLMKTTKDIDHLKSLDDLPPAVNNQFQYLCEIAYKGVMEDKVIFDLGTGLNTLGLLQEVESFAICRTSHSYNFLHLSIQELLAAIHIATKLKACEQTKQFKKLFNHPRFSAVFQFFAAKTKLQTWGIRDVVIQVAQSGDKSLLLSLLHCLFEAQDPSLCHLVANQLNLIFDLQGTSLTPADCFSVGYFLGNINDFEVDLGGCSISVDGCRALFKPGEVYHLRVLG